LHGGGGTAPVAEWSLFYVRAGASLFVREKAAGRGRRREEKKRKKEKEGKEEKKEKIWKKFQT
jgi:hypothetical protein